MDGGPSRSIPMQARSASERKPRRGTRGWTGFPCLRCGLGWTVVRRAPFPCKPEAQARGNRDGEREGGPDSLACAAGLDGRWSVALAWMDGGTVARAWMDGGPSRGLGWTVVRRAGLDGAATSAGRGARRGGPFARASGWPPLPPPRSAARRSPRRSPLPHAAQAGSA